MLQQDDFYRFMRDVIAESAPDKIGDFEKEAPGIIADVCDSGVVPTGVSGEFHFLQEATAVVNFIALIVKTAELIYTFADKHIKTKHPIDESALSREWKKQLISAGVPKRKAETIASRFLLQLETQVRNVHGKSA